MRRQRIRSPGGALAALLVVASLGARAPEASAQQRALPTDTFRDVATRALVERALAARHREVHGIDSYEATLRQRMHVGVTAFRFRRERSLYEHERVARIRWSAEDGQAIQWIGVRTAVPIAGIDTSDPEAGGDVSVGDDAVTVRIAGEEQDEDYDDLATDYLDETDFLGFDFDPAADRLRFGDDWAFHPLSDTALVHYRYSLGDTLRVELPTMERAVVLYEVRVEPRRADFELVAASLWVDSASAALVRATYRPARPWNMRVDEPEEADEVPGFIGPIEAEIDYITIESSLQELEHWLPRRFAFQGEGRVGGFLRVPVTIEWSVGGYVVDEPPFDVLVDGELPAGWQREVTTETDDDGNRTTYTVIVPTSRELRESPALSEDFGRRTPSGFTAAEIDDLAGQLEGLLPPTYQRFRPRLAWGLEQAQLRFNRVEGWSVGVLGTIPLGRELSLEASTRWGTGDRVVNVGAALRKGPERSQWTLEGYHRLQSMSDWSDPFRLTSSATNLLFGTDRGEYYRATGAAVRYRSRGVSVSTEVAGFFERHRSAERTTDFSVRGFLRDDTVAAVLPADELDVAGGRGTLAWFAGTDPASWVLTGAVSAEAGWTGDAFSSVGDDAYRRVDGRLSASHPLVLGLAGAVELGAGTSWGSLPVQRSYFLGSSPTLRGFHANEHFGPTFWRARAELATDFVAARLGLFSDVGWVGERDAFRLDDPLVSVGLGASLLDGIVRMDVARAVRGSSRWKAHLYLDGLF